jgi:hypothetical protein
VVRRLPTVDRVSLTTSAMTGPLLVRALGEGTDCRGLTCPAVGAGRTVVGGAAKGGGEAFR